MLKLASIGAVGLALTSIASAQPIDAASQPPSRVGQFDVQITTDVDWPKSDGKRHAENNFDPQRTPISFFDLRTVDHTLDQYFSQFPDSSSPWYRRTVKRTVTTHLLHPVSDASNGIKPFTWSPGSERLRRQLDPGGDSRCSFEVDHALTEERLRYIAKRANPEHRQALLDFTAAALRQQISTANSKWVQLVERAGGLINCSNSFVVAAHKYIMVADAGVVLQSIIWEPVRGLRIPAMFALPAAASGPVPVVISPPACGESLSLKSPDYSAVQARLLGYAAAGIATFFWEGFCGNGDMRHPGANSLAYLDYPLALGFGFGGGGLTEILGLQALRLIISDTRFDRNRIGAMGFSFGMAQAYELFMSRPELRALAIVGSFGDGAPVADNKAEVPVAGHAQPLRFSAADDKRQVTTRFSYPPQHMYSIPGPPATSPPDASLPPPSSLGVSPAGKLAYWLMRVGFDRAAFVVGATDDPWANFAETERFLTELDDTFERAGFSASIGFHAVQGGHNFSADRHKILLRWLLNYFELPGAGQESEVNREVQGVELAELFDQYAVQSLSDGSAARFARTFLRSWSVMKDDTASERFSFESVLNSKLNDASLFEAASLAKIDLSSDQFDDLSVDHSSFVISESGSPEALFSVVQTNAPGTKPDMCRASVFLLTDKSVPDERDFLSELREGRPVIWMVLPGYGISGYARTNIGNKIAFTLASAPHVLRAMRAGRAILELATAECADQPQIRVFTDGIDAGVIGLLVALGRDSISEFRERRAMASIRGMADFVIISAPPTCLFAGGIFGTFDLPEMRAMIARNSKAIVESVADEREYLKYGPWDWIGDEDKPAYQ